jgi:hypothetical protein
VVNRRLIQGILMQLLWRTVLPIPQISVFAVGERATYLITTKRSQISRIFRARIATRRCTHDQPTLGRWTMCPQRWRKWNQKSCSVCLMSIPLLSLFFFILELRIRSFHKLLLEHIAYLCVPWKTPY